MGKTVLLNEVQTIAEDEGAITDFLEVSVNEPLSVSIIATLRTALLKLDRVKGISDKVKKGLRVLKSYVGAIKVRYEDVEFSIDIDAERGVADSGKLSRDLADLFIAAGDAAKARDTAMVILVDEIQNLPRDEFEALIMAIHRTDQKQLPLMVVGAGLPLLIRLTGDTKSYSERLFDFPEIGPLDDAEASRALVAPAKEAGVAFDEAAVKRIIDRTKGYPYFLQEWGYQTWNCADTTPITARDVKRPSSASSRGWTGISSDPATNGCQLPRKPICSRWRSLDLARTGQATLQTPWTEHPPNWPRSGMR